MTNMSNTGRRILTHSQTTRLAACHTPGPWHFHPNEDGKPISNQLGGPVRLVTPQMYAYKSVKWLNRIELIEGDHVGYWEQRGYDIDAWLPNAKRV